MLNVVLLQGAEHELFQNKIILNWQNSDLNQQYSI